VRSDGDGQKAREITGEVELLSCRVGTERPPAQSGVCVTFRVVVKTVCGVEVRSDKFVSDKKLFVALKLEVRCESPTALSLYPSSHLQPSSVVRPRCFSLEGSLRSPTIFWRPVSTHRRRLFLPLVQNGHDEGIEL